MSGNSSSSDVPCTLERRRSLRSSTPVKIGGVQFVRSPSPTGNENDACSTPFGPVAVGKGNKFGFKQQRIPRPRQDVKQDNYSMNATASSSNTTNNEQKFMVNQCVDGNQSQIESQNQSMTESTSQIYNNQSLRESSKQTCIKSSTESCSNQLITESTALSSSNESSTKSSNQSIMESSVQSYRNQSITESNAFNTINKASAESFTNQSLTKSTNQGYNNQSCSDSSRTQSVMESTNESMVQNFATYSHTETNSNRHSNQSISTHNQSNETQMFESSSSTSNYSNTLENGFINFGLHDSKGIENTNEIKAYKENKIENASFEFLLEASNNSQSLKSAYQKLENKDLTLQDHESYNSEVNQKCNFSSAVQKPIKGWQSSTTETTTTTKENLMINHTETNNTTPQEKMDIIDYFIYLA